MCELDSVVGGDTRRWGLNETETMLARYRLLKWEPALSQPQLVGDRIVWEASGTNEHDVDPSAANHEIQMQYVQFCPRGSINTVLAPKVKFFNNVHSLVKKASETSRSLY